jgi:hypothetical protein
MVVNGVYCFLLGVEGSLKLLTFKKGGIGDEEI